MSAAFRMISTVYWNHHIKYIHRPVQKAIELAIKSKLPFHENDFDLLPRGGKGPDEWLFACTLEHLYRLAVESDNVSACKALEHWGKRRPVFLDGQRMYVGREFQWQGEKVRCTSLADGEFIACSYTPDKQRYNGKIKRRYCITIADLRAHSKRQREIAKSTTA